MSYLRPHQFALVAHRGGSFEGPENTIEAFGNTLKIYDQSVFELDIHQTRDGEIVVIHDEKVDRTTNGHGYVKDFNYKELSQLDAGFHTKWKGKGVIVSRLSDILQHFPQSRISVEFKTEGYEKQTIEIIRKHNAQDRIVLASFSQNALNTARKLAPEMCSGFGGREVSRMVLACRTHLNFIAPRRGQVFQIPLSRNGIDVYTKNFLELSHKLSKHVHVWTVNDEIHMRALLASGVDGIITDNPRALYNIALEFKKFN